MLVLCTGLLFGATGCYVTSKKDNGKHKGWYKNTNNPHSPKSKKNKGKPHTLIQEGNQIFCFQESDGVTIPDVYNNRVSVAKAINP